MAKMVKIAPNKQASGLWQIKVPAWLSDSARRKSEYFKTKGEALSRIAQIERIAECLREQERLMAPAEYEGICEQLARLQPFGITLAEVVDYYVLRHQAQDAKVIDFIAPLYLLELVDHSTQYRARVRQILERFVADFQGLMIDDLIPIIVSKYYKS